MTGKENDPVIRTSTSSRRTDRNSVLHLHPREFRSSRVDSDIPVMPETLLLIELEAKETCVDLGAVSQLVLGDMGATLQVLRLAGRTDGDAASRSTRVEDCVATLGVQSCLDAASAKLIPRGDLSQRITELWRHSGKIARQSKKLAEMTLDIDPGQAYVVGLCHAIGVLPAVLGWSGVESQRSDPLLVGLGLARQWSLPSYVFDYFSDLHRGGGRSPWPKIVKAAHARIEQHLDLCACSEDLSPQLRWAV